MLVCVWERNFNTLIPFTVLVVCYVPTFYSSFHDHYSCFLEKIMVLFHQIWQSFDIDELLMMFAGTDLVDQHLQQQLASLKHQQQLQQQILLQQYQQQRQQLEQEHEKQLQEHIKVRQPCWYSTSFHFVAFMFLYFWIFCYQCWLSSNSCFEETVTNDVRCNTSGQKMYLSQHLSFMLNTNA